MPNPNPGKVPLTVPVTVNLPEGYELADTKMRPSHVGEWYLDNSIGGARRRVGEEHPNAMRVILRPIVSATVMVEMTREDAEYHASWTGGSNIAILRLAVSARAALARKPYPQFDPAKHVDPTLGPDEVRLDGKVYKLKLPCPVMVCGLRQTACYSDEPERCLDRRPCKHSEGHGGEHE